MAAAHGPPSQPAIRAAAVVLALALLTTAGCSRQFLSVVFDMPAPKPPAVAATAAPPPVAPPALTAEDTLRPPIESVWAPDSVVQMLPKDHAGNIDWVAALREGVIRPRSSIPGEAAPAPSSFVFGFDFYFKGPAPTFDAYFPHSVHTEWVDCGQCHGRIFRYRDTEFKMADILQGSFCGECHGKVSFPPVTACERCHTGLPQPPDRAEPLLLGTLRLHRVAPDTTAAPPADAPSTVAAADGAAPLPDQVVYSQTTLPPAKFDHWVHRIRFTCKTCHMEIFEPKAGANAITMRDIQAGEACGRCHDGKTAFAAGFSNCQRCHAPLEAPAKAP